MRCRKSRGRKIARSAELFGGIFVALFILGFVNSSSRKRYIGF